MWRIADQKRPLWEINKTRGTYESCRFDQDTNAAYQDPSVVAAEAVNLEIFIGHRE